MTNHKYRTLYPEETIQSGDEFGTEATSWHPVRTSMGRTVVDARLNAHIPDWNFRRPVTEPEPVANAFQHDAMYFNDNGSWSRVPLAAMIPAQLSNDPTLRLQRILDDYDD